MKKHLSAEGEASTAEQIEVLKIRHFIYRLVKTPIGEIKVTGDPSTDKNTEFLGGYHETESEKGESVTITKLDLVRALEIDSILAGHYRGQAPDIPRGLAMFEEFISHRVKLYTDA